MLLIKILIFLKENNGSAKNLNIAQRILSEAVDSLKEKQRNAFKLHYLEGLSHEEIASILKISEGTSKSNTARAKINVRKLNR